MSRSLLCLLLLAGCGGTDSSDPSMRPAEVCVYSTAKCFPDICDGCTAGGYGKCPPKDYDWVEICREVDDNGCKAMAVPPEMVSPSSTLLRYTKDVRLLGGIASCAAYRQSGVAAATSVTPYCSGTCM